MSDSISNFIIKLKNASNAGNESLTFPYSKLIASVAEVLRKEGYVEQVSKKGKKVTKLIEVKLPSAEQGVVIKGVKRISKLSKRLYYKAQDIAPVRNGFGTLIISTPKGILTGLEAKRSHVGGEPLFKIW